MNVLRLFSHSTGVKREKRLPEFKEKMSSAGVSKWTFL